MRKLGGVTISSSVNPQELGKTVEGIILGLSSIIILIASVKGVTILPEQIQTIASNIGSTISAVGIAISAITTTFGLLRKAVVKFSSEC